MIILLHICFIYMAWRDFVLLLALSELEKASLGWRFFTFFSKFKLVFFAISIAYVSDIEEKKIMRKTKSSQKLSEALFYLQILISFSFTFVSPSLTFFKQKLEVMKCEHSSRNLEKDKVGIMIHNVPFHGRRDHSHYESDAAINNRFTICSTKFSRSLFNLNSEWSERFLQLKLSTATPRTPVVHRQRKMKIQWKRKRNEIRLEVGNSRAWYNNSFKHLDTNLNGTWVLPVSFFLFSPRRKQTLNFQNEFFY